MLERVTQWLERDPDPRTREELQYLIDEKMHDELDDRFRTRLKFGTAGLRGKVGCGPNRMNRLVVQQTATGLGHYLVNKVKNVSKRGVVIGYDGRNDSKQFAHDCASVLTALGIKVYFTSREAPTPLVAFGVLHLNCAAAVVITASHNPPEYNGFKVFWENGAQILPPHDKGIAYEIDVAADKPIPLMSLDDAHKHNLLEWLGEGYEQAYQQAILNQDLLESEFDPSSITIAYTALHGVGGPLAMSMLNQSGFRNVINVQEQHLPNGDFPGIEFPNPEEKGAMDMVIELADSIDADLACANDPDADRFAVAVRTKQGEYKKLSGDQIGLLFADYLLQRFNDNRESRVLNHPSAPIVGNTIVSSRLLEQVAAYYNAEYYQALTGFKWLSNIAMQYPHFESNYLLSYEESIGYCIGPIVRDKDGLSALVVFAQLAAQLVAQGSSVLDKLASLYRQYGYYLTEQHSIQLTYSDTSIAEKLRENPPQRIAGLQVLVYEDLQQSLRFIEGGATQVLNLPCSDVLIYYLEENIRVIVRPSGTEPKLKCYYEVIEPMSANDNFGAIERQAQKTMDKLIDAHQISLLALSGQQS
ncbi:phospho-sugar mutase [uncultured Vibrio sp.]|uniref:phospho-sugar mutase n=1 Tax=uncultured Vibrio sp. TaxID=114054 RepID=UPI0025F8C494|nr:phospho-sugar mutase [uncultured Vibrio sp.]